MNPKLLFNQIKIQLPRVPGVRIEIEEDKMNFIINGRLELSVRESGGVSFEPNCSYTPETKQLSDKVIETSKFVREYLTTIDEAPEFNVEGVGNQFKLIAQFNNTVLAARTMQDENVEFVTWERDSSGVSAGHYYGNNFIGAKEDFASRANLVNPDKIFSTDELVEIYRCVEDTLAGEYELTNGQEEMLAEIKGKIKEVVPDVIERAIEAGEEFEQEQGYIVFLFNKIQ